MNLSQKKKCGNHSWHRCKALYYYPEGWKCDLGYRIKSVLIWPQPIPTVIPCEPCPKPMTAEELAKCEQKREA